ncbi:MAG: sigma-54 dependent transcriptional regulator [Candidatus Marinimicrobia bacterium]|nr:sigma-54 dependent transcriptional regulator [Candidatus Neomarinimicrobiota bacterium]
MSKRIVVIDDEVLILGFLKDVLANEEYEVQIFSSANKAIAHIDENEVDLVITDVQMNEMTGDDILNYVKKNKPETGVIIITGFGNVSHAVRSLQKGAFDYITKPFKAKEIIQRVRRFFDGANSEISSADSLQSKLSDNNSDKTGTKPLKESKSPLTDTNKEVDFIGEAPAIKRLLDILPQLANNMAPILIQGESGTGKEVFASLVHSKSKRANKPYIKINCANLPSELVESTLFGHVKGAFTGAIADRDGAFHAAQGGTLLLDEITEIDIQVQAKLLRVLQENEFYKVGSQKPVKADVRILATSNRNIGQAIKNKEFREDLYFRLNVFPVEIPPLRDRKSDIPILTKYFVDQYCLKYDYPDLAIDEEMHTYLRDQNWRGNVRELNNKIHRGVILAQEDGLFKVDHIENSIFTSLGINDDDEDINNIPLMTIEDMELHLINKALEKTNGNQKEAAKLLGISDRTIRNKLKEKD